MRFKLAIILTLLIPNIMKSQNATATIEDALSCSGDTTLVAVDVTNFIDVAAMTLFIGYDTNAAEFLSLQNVHPAVTGFLNTNATNGQVGIAYSSINPFNITSGKLFDLKFVFSGDSSYLPFENGTEIANSDLEIIPLDTFPGSISNGIVIIDQPDSVQAYPDNDVLFTVTTTGNVTYQWQENPGNGWFDLQNNSTYAGVDNDTLMVYDVALSFNGFLYRCLLTSGNCSDTSGIALLEVALAFPVATLGIVQSCPDMSVLEPLYVGDFFDVIEFTFNISYDTSNLEFQELSNLNPLLDPSDITVSIFNSPPGVSVHWEDPNPVSITSGKLFDLNFFYQGQNITLAFEDGTEVLNSFSNPINITLTDGHINQFELPVITQQPQDITVTEGDDAYFEVVATGASSYQWQVSINGGSTWTNLTNSPPYYNVTAQEMTISPVALGMNENLYACIIGNENCAVISDYAELTVDSLNSLGENIESIMDVIVRPNPFTDHLNLYNSINCSDLQIRIYNTNGLLVYSEMHQQNIPLEVGIDLSHLNNGLYLLKVTGKIQEKYINETKKIIKTN